MKITLSQLAKTTEGKRFYFQSNNILKTLNDKDYLHPVWGEIYSKCKTRNLIKVLVEFDNNKLVFRIKDNRFQEIITYKIDYENRKISLVIP